MIPAGREVVVTGLGALCAVGTTVDACWDAWRHARSGVRRLDNAWLQGRTFNSRVGAPLGDIDLTQWGYSQRDMRWMDRVQQYALAAAGDALRSAGFTPCRRDAKDGAFTVEGLDPRRASVVIGTGMGGLGSVEAGHLTYLKNGSPAGAGPLRQAVLMTIPNGPAAQVALRHGFQGECKATCTACAAGTMAIGDACRLIWSDDADVVLAGGAEAVLSDHDGLGLFGFDALRCLSTNNDDPHRASRPFHALRDGFVLGDGAGILVLESRAHAEARGARILARILSYATACQALSMVQPDVSGERPARVLAMALRKAGIEPGDVGAYNAHATSTQAGDVAEIRAFRLALGAASDDVLVHSLKGSTGHAIAGSGALETIAAVLSLQAGIVPPTANLDEVDPECRAPHVRGEAAMLPRRVVLKASFGFGGHDSALVLAS